MKYTLTYVSYSDIMEFAQNNKEEYDSIMNINNNENKEIEDDKNINNSKTGLIPTFITVFTLTILAFIV